MGKQATGSSDLSQLDKFKKAARNLDCDDDEARFNERLGELVKPKREESEAD